MSTDYFHCRRNFEALPGVKTVRSGPYRFALPPSPVRDYLAEHVADVVRVGTREAVGAHLLRDLSGKAFLVDVAVGGARREDLEVHARHFALAAARREVAFDVRAAVSQDRGLVGDQLPIARRRRLAKRDAVGYLGDDGER